MRSPLLGVCGRDPTHVAALVRASTLLTHTDPAAERGALAVALAARLGAERGPVGVTVDALEAALPAAAVDPALAVALSKMRAAVAREADAAAFADDLGLKRGVSGYVNHTVPVALFCWLRWPADYEAGVSAAVRAGGDTDTVAAITGALIGATAGAEAIPSHWLAGLAEWPRSVRWMERLAAALATASDDWAGSAGRAVPLCWPGLMPRNVLFLLVVLAHAFRRLLPPY